MIDRGNMKIRLPGICFRTAPSGVGEALPRMDIAAFVGFSASGPVDTPVAVEDLDRFLETFGNNRVCYPYLYSTVEAFFKNGGRRCWVVRVKDDPGPECFLDSLLADVEAGLLVDEANSRYFMKEKKPKGIHCLLNLEEITLLAVPDAIRESGTELVRLHEAVLRFCAARGDVFAVLGMPCHYDPKHVVEHVEKLRTLHEFRKLLSFGGLYHPWILTGSGTDGSGSFRYVPPDGAVCGIMAARAIRRGAWIAPANEPFRDVIALNPVIDREDIEALFEKQVNIIREFPRGFLVMSAFTLDTSSGMEAVNGRRLSMLLRRLVLREGMKEVFRPNDENFRRSVQLSFENLLNRIYALGAFAGESPGTSFQVVSDSSVNTPGEYERGRFILELRIAPSRPMAFITIRLVQTPDKGFSILEI